MQLTFEFVERTDPEQPLAQVWKELDTEVRRPVVTLLATLIVKALAKQEHDDE